MKITAAPPRRFSPSTLAFVSIGVVVVIVLVFVIVKVTGSGKSTSTTQLIPDPVTAPASLVAEVTGVSPAVSNAGRDGVRVSAPSGPQGPAQAHLDRGQARGAVHRRRVLPLLRGRAVVDGAGPEPVRHVVGAEDDHVVAVGLRSGHRHVHLPKRHVDEPVPSTSCPSSTRPTTTSAPGTRKLFQPLTTAQSNLWQKYSSQFGETTGYPFVDFGNKVFVLGPSYDPGVLAGLDQQEIAAKLTNPTDPVTQGIVGTANYLTAVHLRHDGEPAGVGVLGVGSAEGGRVDEAELMARSMSRRGRRRGLRRRAARVPRWWPWAAFALSLIGFGISLYLTIEHFQGKLLPCPANGFVNCTKVTTSKYSYVFGRARGVGRAALLHGHGGHQLPAAVEVPARWVARARLALAVSGICFVLYLLGAELFSIKAICLWCTGVHITTFFFFVLMVASFPAHAVPGGGPVDEWAEDGDEA